MNPETVRHGHSRQQPGKGLEGEQDTEGFSRSLTCWESHQLFLSFERWW